MPEDEELTKREGEGSYGGSPIYLGACLPACPLSGKAGFLEKPNVNISSVSFGKISRRCFSAIVWLPAIGD